MKEKKSKIMRNLTLKHAIVILKYIIKKSIVLKLNRHTHGRNEEKSHKDLNIKKLL